LCAAHITVAAHSVYSDYTHTILQRATSRAHDYLDPLGRHDTQ